MEGHLNGVFSVYPPDFGHFSGPGLLLTLPFESCTMTIGAFSRSQAELSRCKIILENKDEIPIFTPEIGYALGRICIPPNQRVDAHRAYTECNRENSYYEQFYQWKTTQLPSEYLCGMAAWNCLVIRRHKRVITPLEALFKRYASETPVGLADSLARHVKHFGFDRIEWLFVLYVSLLFFRPKKSKCSPLAIIPNPPDSLRKRRKNGKLVNEPDTRWALLLEEYRWIGNTYATFMETYDIVMSGRTRHGNNQVKCITCPKEMYVAYSTLFGEAPAHLAMKSDFAKIKTFMKRFVWNLHVDNTLFDPSNPWVIFRNRPRPLAFYGDEEVPRFDLDMPIQFQ